MEKVVRNITVKDIGRGDEIWNELGWFGPEVASTFINARAEFCIRTVNGGLDNLGIDLNRVVTVRRYH